MDRTERDSKWLVFYVGLACGVAISASVLSGTTGGALFAHQPLLGGLISGVVLVAALGFSLYRRAWLGVLSVVTLIPLVVGTAANRSAGHTLLWAQALRAASVVLIFSLAIGTALFYARRFRELERLLFAEATSAAFFVTVIGAAAYGLIAQYMNLPRLSLVWVSVFGLFSWVVLSWIFGRRYL